MLERAEKKLLLEMVNRESSKQSTESNNDNDTGGARGMSSEELLEDIKFGCEAIFGASTDNKMLPSWKEHNSKRVQ